MFGRISGSILKRGGASRALIPSVLMLSITAAALAACAKKSGTVDPRAESLPEGAVWLGSLDLGQMTTGYARGLADQSVNGNPIRIAGVAFPHGVGTHADSEMTIELAGEASRFVAEVGLDDQIDCIRDMDAPKLALVRFQVFVDGKSAADSGVLHFGDKPKRLDVDLAGAKQMRLEVRKEQGARFTHADWGGAAIVLRAKDGVRPKALPPGKDAIGKLPPPAAPAPPRAISDEESAWLTAGQARSGSVWVDSLDLSLGRSREGKLGAGKTPAGEPLTVGGVVYAHGVGALGEAELHIELGSSAKRFLARVGMDSGFQCGKAVNGGGARFAIWIDGRKQFDSGVLSGKRPPVDVALDVTGAARMVLVTQMDDLQSVNLSWGGALLLLDPSVPEKPKTVAPLAPPPVKVAKFDANELGIFAPRAVGTTPGRAFVFRVPASGKPPLSFSARGLPAGLKLDAKTGIISGVVKKAGDYSVGLSVRSSQGTATGTVYIEAGENKLARTPPLGFNSWNAWGTDVDDKRIRATIDAMVARGLVARGFRYVNIDDGWQGKRNADGILPPNEKFPDMKGLADYAHRNGLLLGIYSSPGPLSCAGYDASYKYEDIDARTWALWGVDLLKYDWCSYGKLADENNLQDLQKPYRKMGDALAKTGRDIVFSFSEHGRGKVWAWGKLVGGHMWRQTNDIVDTWGSVERIGFFDFGSAPYAGPGSWNDADMLVVGSVGWKGTVRPSRLTDREAQTHITMWSLAASPLLIGADLGSTSDYVIDLLTNPEVIAVNQDPLGKQARQVSARGGTEVWSRPLSDGTLAIGLFNRAPTEQDVTADFGSLTGNGVQPVRDLWQRKDVGEMDRFVSSIVPPHGALLFKVGKANPVAWRPN